MANADIPINVTAHELELSVTNNFVLESLVLENTTVATQDLTGDIIKISAVINRNCARYTLTSNSIKVNCVDANQVSVYETNPNTTYCIKFSELVYDDVSKTGTGRLIIEDVTVNDDGTIVVDDYENIIAIFETDATRKYKVGSEKSYPYNYDTQKLQGIVEEKQDKLTIDDSLSSTSTNPIQNKAVFDALNKKYEVIETVTTTEEISLFVRSAEPNGTAYKFDRLKVLIELPAASAKSPITIKMQKDSAGSWVFYYNNAIGIDTVKSYLYCEAYKEYGYWQSTTARTTGEYGFGNKTNQVPAFWLFSEKTTPNIGHLRIEGNLPIGTKITILGVRA